MYGRRTPDGVTTNRELLFHGQADAWPVPPVKGRLFFGPFFFFVIFVFKHSAGLMRQAAY